MSDRHICKAKRTDNGKWLEGYYCKRKTGHYTDICFVEEYKDCIIREFSDGGISWGDVDSETICQCTGLPDKNGNMIFEWDIVREEKEIGVVKFGKYGNSFHYGFYIEWATLPDFRQELAYWNGRVERIGTFFDNQELLKGGAE